MRRWIKIFVLIFTCCLSGVAYAQLKQVKGTVTFAADGQPIIGAYVEVLGTELKTITDLDGNFEFQNLPATAKSVKVSYLGVKDRTLPISESMKFVMQDDAEMLEGVVVTGMQQLDRRLFTGSATKVSAADAKLDGMADVSRSLEGRAAGRNIRNRSEDTRARCHIHLRQFQAPLGRGRSHYVGCR